jgi:hypothetical protein
MKRYLVALFLGTAAAIGAVPASAEVQGVFAAAPYMSSPAGIGQYTPVSDATATGLTVPTGATYAVVCFEGSNHRFTWDGQTTPTASVGSLVGYGPGVCMTLMGQNTLSAFKAIAVSAGGTFTVSYGK